MDLENSTIVLIVCEVIGLFALITLFRSFFTVKQGEVVVISRFGKFLRTANPGLNMKDPWIDGIYATISVMNHSEELKFQAITTDQANVNFKVMLLYAVMDSQPETIHKVAYKFNTDQEFVNALNRSVEGTVRTFIASKRQAEILTLRREIIEYVKEHLDETLAGWGYHLIDLQVNDIAFDAEITESMARVVSSANLRAAAENEGAALLITKTKAAEAEGKAIIIQAESEKEAARLRGEGVAAYRQAVSKGIGDSAAELKDQGVGQDVIMFSMWTEGIKQFAEVGKGNVIFLDGSTDGFQRVMAQLKQQTPITNGKAYAQ